MSLADKVAPPFGKAVLKPKLSCLLPLFFAPRLAFSYTLTLTSALRTVP